MATRVKAHRLLREGDIFLLELHPPWRGQTIGLILPSEPNLKDDLTCQ